MLAGTHSLRMPQRLLAFWRSGAIDQGRVALVMAASVLLSLVACAPPIQVERADPAAVRRELEANVISTGDLSELTWVVLRFANLSDSFAIDPEGTILALH